MQFTDRKLFLTDRTNSTDSKVRFTDRYRAAILDNPPRDENYYLQPWTNCVGKCQKQEIIIVISTE